MDILPRALKKQLNSPRLIFFITILLVYIHIIN